MAENKGILVVGEMEEGKLASISKELLGGARQIADPTKEEVSLLLIGEKGSSLAQEAITLGADKVYLAAHPSFAEFHGEAYTFLISELCKQTQPALCLMGQTDWGREVAPRVAARLGAGLGCRFSEPHPFAARNLHFVQVRYRVKPEIPHSPQRGSFGMTQFGLIYLACSLL